MNPTTLLPPWDPRLPHDLRLFGEQTILRPLGLSVRDYSTTRVLSGNPAASVDVLGTVPLGAAVEHAVVEGFNAPLLKYCASRGLNPKKVVDESACQHISEAAREIVAIVPACSVSVSELVRTIHMIDAAGEDYDSSYSDPAMPFSIFISVPASLGRRPLLRVAEGLVHEAMHLQLSLFESICQLVDESVGWRLYSPWKRTKRQTQGILHGLYVFGVLKWMWMKVRTTSNSDEDRRFAEKRIREIAEDVEAVRGVIESPALTAPGRLFAEALLHHSAA